MRKVNLIILFVVAVLSLTFYGEARGEYGRTPDTSIDPSVIQIDEGKYLGAKLDGEVELEDSKGKSFKLGDLYGKPTILVFSYFNCDGACPTISRDLKRAVGKADGIVAGKDFNVVTISFDKSDNRDEANKFAMMTGTNLEGWRVAITRDTEDISRLTESAGYKFFWSPRDGAFIHPTVFIFLSPEGRIVRYLYGASLGGTDIRTAIAEADFGTPGKSKVRDLSDLFLIACYSYNYKEGKYSLNYPLFIAAGAFIFSLSLTVFGILIFKRKVRR